MTDPKVPRYRMIVAEGAYDEPLIVGEGAWCDSDDVAKLEAELSEVRVREATYLEALRIQDEENARLRRALHQTRRPLEAYIADLTRDGYDETATGHEAEMVLTLVGKALEETT